MTERREDKQPDDVDVIKIGRSYYRRIPPRQRDYLDVDENTTLKTQLEYSEKYGRYISTWNPAQQQEDEN